MIHTRQLRQIWITRFDFLGGALPGKVEPTDIDQGLERRGHFLFIECKRPHQPISRGQAIMFDALLRLSSPDHDVRVLLVIGQPPDQIEAACWWGQKPAPHTTDEVRALVRRWWDWAGTR